MEKKVWFITGASRGLGRVWAEAALGRGDKVAVTARKLADITDLKERFGDAVLPMVLDVTDAEQVQHVVRQAHAHFGKLDVVLNNAGYTLIGMVEEASEADVRALFDTNYFGYLRVIQAALPLLRKQGNGHFLSVSSALGIEARPLIGFYCSSKFAVEGLHESLAHEVKGFGIKVTLLEPGSFATEFGLSGKQVPEMAAYTDIRKQISERLMNEERGNPQATAEAILKIVDAEEPPLRFALGSEVLPMARAIYADRIATWETWETVSYAAQCTPTK
jgi:NAD(P)-dependent dehydrogenase (short-subunit alcohol dehydrogenase family)